MQVTVKIPDAVAAQAQARGLPVETYVQNLIDRAGAGEQTEHARTPEEIQAFLKGMAEGSERLPSLPTDAFTRESFYRDCR